jgi:four helix bundle protein
MSLKSYRDLEVWQKAMDLTELVYSITKEYPNDERYGLTSQSRKAAVSVPSNIAEGYGRTHRGDYLKFLSNARGSLCELETQLILAVRLKFVTREAVIPAWNLCQQIGRMLLRLILKLADDHHPKPQSTPPPAQ